ncbi:receptor-type tyrosine-protein phosphatase gamma-like [Saccostrea echinata]|uniref:receptor-type tyrosine-protein phosphatase gamma-like n=1 Tax=Saccostrea echinata TaxID=191078 RepID=UPI002A7F1EA1|nr:receptor-type tyrosine-protein phosphatase gamma-like [Saccostrea echinata]
MVLDIMNFPFVLCQLFIITHQYENLASKKTVTVSSRYNNGYFPPSKAVDGDKSTYLLDCSLTASGQKEAWLTVDLGENKNIASISILHGGLGLDASSINSDFSGLHRDSDGDGQVYGYNPFRRVCGDDFDTENAQVVCLIWGFLPDNPSPSKLPETSSLQFLDNKPNCNGNEVSINKCPKGSSGCGSGNGVSVKCKKGSTLSGFSVYVSDTEDWRSGTLCYQHDIQQIPPNNVILDCITSGRYVTVYNKRSNTTYPDASEFSYINICEIDVIGCEMGFYGVNCTRCPGNCLNDSCHFQIGECFECKDGYTGEYCKTECPVGQYGQGCSFRCGSCLGNKPCNHINGSCPDGCSPGWRGDKCDQECDQSFYGQQCNISCSEYCKGRLCNPTTGQCDGCIDGRSGFFCETEVIVNTAGAVVSEEAPFLMIGAAFGALVLILLVLLIICLIVRRKRRLDTKTEDAIGLQTQITPMSERKVNYYLEQIDQEGKGDQANVYYNVSYVVNSEEQEELEQEDTESEIETGDDLQEIELLSENLGDIPVKELHDYILRKHENIDEGFKAEFKALPEGDINRCSVGSLEKNILKNRFKNTLPYDHSRVILTDPYGEDYINANFIPSMLKEKEYIACQGPKAITVKDLWRMIWQENVTNVVMLTGIIEGQKRKCEQYWPNQGRTIIYGKLAVTNKLEVVYACYTVRNLEVRNTQDKNATLRAFTHFHFTGWPDHGVPSTSQLLSFYFKVREQIAKDKQRRPLVVHCSAGVGRTGTFIAIDALVQYGLKTGSVNITKYVSVMRRERMHMIQTSGQYITVYKCLDEYFNFPRHVVTRDKLANHTADKDALHKEYTEFVNYIKQQRQYEAINIAEEHDAMDNQPLVVAEYPSVWLEEGIVVCHYPKAKEVSEFMSILTDCSPSVIMTLDSLDEQLTTKQWIPEDHDLVIGRYVVKKTKSRVVSLCRRISTTRITIQHGDDEEIDVRIVQAMQSEKSVYSNTTQLSDIIDAVTSMPLDREKPIMIIHEDNNTDVLMAAVVLNSLYQLMFDGETDVCFMARYLHVLQPSEMLKYEQFEECYKLLRRFSTKEIVVEKNEKQEDLYAN